MASNQDRYKATLGSSGSTYDLEMQDIGDQFEKAIAKYEFPYRDGALLEDMGQKARTVKFKCFFYGGEAAYEAHKQLLNDLEKNDLWELMHPKYGMMKGCIETVGVRHDDRALTAEIDISFVENLRGEIEPGEYVEVEAATEEAFVDGQDEQMAEFEQDCRDDLGAEAENILTIDLDPELPLLGQFSDLSATARDYIKTVDAYVGEMKAVLSDITNPANSLLALIDYGVNLPGIVIGAVAKTAERYAMLYESLKTAPARFLDSLKGSLEALETVGTNNTSSMKEPSLVELSLQKHTTIAGAQRCAVEMGGIYKTDEMTRQQVRRAEKTRSFDSLGRYSKPQAIAPIMTINEIEYTLAGARSYLQTAVELSRGMQSLKATARDLLEHVNVIKLERDKIITTEINLPTPLHLICLMQGLPYNYAERMYAINDIPQPNFTQGEVKTYVR